MPTQVKSLNFLLNPRISLLPNGRDRKRNTGLARPFYNHKGKPTIACN